MAESASSAGSAPAANTPFPNADDGSLGGVYFKPATEAHQLNANAATGQIVAALQQSAAGDDFYPGIEVAGLGDLPTRSQDPQALDPRYRARIETVMRRNVVNATTDFSTQRQLLGLDGQIERVNRRIDGLYGMDSGLRSALVEERAIYEQGKAMLNGSTPLERAENLAIGTVLGVDPRLDRAGAGALVDQWRRQTLDSSTPVHRDVHAALLDPKITHGLLGVDPMNYDGGYAPIGTAATLAKLAPSPASYYARTGFGVGGRLERDVALAARIADIAQEGHALTRHGGSVTDAQLLTRAHTGVAPDGSSVVRNGQVQIPPSSTAFASDDLLAQADQLVRAKYLDRAIILSKPGAQRVTVEGVDMGKIVGRGYDRVTSIPGGVGPLQYRDNLSRVTAVYEYHPPPRPGAP